MKDKSLGAFQPLVELYCLWNWECLALSSKKHKNSNKFIICPFNTAKILQYWYFGYTSILGSITKKCALFSVHHTVVLYGFTIFYFMLSQVIFESGFIYLRTADLLSMARMSLMRSVLSTQD